LPSLDTATVCELFRRLLLRRLHHRNVCRNVSSKTPCVSEWGARCHTNLLGRLASISTVPEVLTLRTGLHSNTEDSPVGALAIESTEFRNLVILYRIHHSLPRAVSAV